MGKWLSMRVTTKHNRMRASQPHWPRKARRNRHGMQLDRPERQPNPALVQLTEQQALKRHQKSFTIKPHAFVGPRHTLR